MKQKKIMICLTERQERYARALSLRVPGCKRPKKGSVAHGLKWSLQQQADIEKIKLE